MRAAKVLPAGPAPMTQTSAMGCSRQAEPRGFRLGRESEVSLKAIVQPAPDVIACWPTAADDLVMTAAAAEISRPAGRAGLLAVNMLCGQPIGLARKIDAVVERPHHAILVADKTV